MNNQNTGGAMKPHKHVEVIKAWADGALIQFRTGSDSPWMDVVGDPVWNGNCDYRVKPAEPERVYPMSGMRMADFDAALANSPYSFELSAAVRIANAALRHACDAGQVVTREEFNRAVGERSTRGLAIAKHVRHKCYTSSQQAIGRLDLAELVAEVEA
jgi:hypothetical protein